MASAGAEQQLAAIAQQENPALLEGEDGTCKETVAWYIHRASARAEGPFVPVRCREAAASLLEVELFGALKGSFIGRSSEITGAFEQARGGTIYLEDIDKPAISFQVKLLRFLEEGTFLPLGDSKLRSSDCRVICSMTRSLRGEIAALRFRPDLAPHFQSRTLYLAPLRERADEIPELCQQLREMFLQRELRGLFAEGQAPSFASKGLAGTRQGLWAGNLRELEETILCAIGGAEQKKRVSLDAIRLQMDSAQRQDSLRAFLDRTLQSFHQQHPKAYDESVTFLDRAEQELATFRAGRSRVWNSAGPSPAIPYPHPPLVPGRLAAEVATMLRRDALREPPRWPPDHPPPPNLQSWPLIHQEGLGFRLFPLPLDMLLGSVSQGPVASSS